MLISERYKFVYLANPKTGTTSIESSFRKYADLVTTGGPAIKHTSYRKFKKFFPIYEKRFEVLVNVRDPIETLYSWYRYRQRDSLQREQNSTAGMTFSEFIDQWAQDAPPAYANVGTSVDFVLAANGDVPDISIFRYDGTPSLHDYLAEKIGKPVKAKSLNVSPTGNGEDLGVYRDRRAELPKLARAYEIYEKLPCKNA